MTMNLCCRDAYYEHGCKCSEKFIATQGHCVGIVLANWEEVDRTCKDQAGCGWVPLLRRKQFNKRVMAPGPVWLIVRVVEDDLWKLEYEAGCGHVETKYGFAGVYRTRDIALDRASFADLCVKCVLAQWGIYKEKT